MDKTIDNTGLAYFVTLIQEYVSAKDMVEFLYDKLSITRKDAKEDFKQLAAHYYLTIVSDDELPILELDTMNGSVGIYYKFTRLFADSDRQIKDFQFACERQLNMVVNEMRIFVEQIQKAEKEGTLKDLVPEYLQQLSYIGKRYKDAQTELTNQWNLYGRGVLQDIGDVLKGVETDNTLYHTNPLTESLQKLQEMKDTFHVAVNNIFNPVIDLNKKALAANEKGELPALAASLEEQLMEQQNLLVETTNGLVDKHSYPFKEVIRQISKELRDAKEEE